MKQGGGKEKGRELDTSREHPLMKNMAPRLLGAWLRAGLSMQAVEISLFSRGLALTGTGADTLAWGVPEENLES